METLPPADRKQSWCITLKLFGKKNNCDLCKCVRMLCLADEISKGFCGAQCSFLVLCSCSTEVHAIVLSLPQFYRAKICFFFSISTHFKELCKFFLSSWIFIIHISNEFKIWSTNQLLIPQNYDIVSTVVAALEIQCAIKIQQ